VLLAGPKAEREDVDGVGLARARPRAAIDDQIRINCHCKSPSRVCFKLRAVTDGRKTAAQNKGIGASCAELAHLRVDASRALCASTLFFFPEFLSQLPDPGAPHAYTRRPPANPHGPERASSTNATKSLKSHHRATQLRAVNPGACIESRSLEAPGNFLPGSPVPGSQSLTISLITSPARATPPPTEG
jgi:hypothetical protein